MSERHAPTPFRFEVGIDNTGSDKEFVLGAITDDSGFHVARIWADIGEAEGTASFILHACNSHEKLHNAAIVALAAIRGEVSPSVAEFALQEALEKAGVSP